MGRKRYSAEQIFTKLREAEVLDRISDLKKNSCLRQLSKGELYPLTWEAS